MSKRYDDGDDGPPERHETCDERDKRMDRAYDFDRGTDGDLSVLAIVARDQDALAEEFFARWWPEHRFDGETWKAALHRFEISRFGAPLFHSAARILGFAVSKRIDWRPTEVKQTSRPKMPAAERQKRFDEAIGRKAREAYMPPIPRPMTDGQVNERENELREQAKGI